MPGRVVTSHDVALRAGVSRSAVSRCFTPGASVADETRQRVLEAAKALGYRPNAIARSLNKGASRIIAVVLGYMDNPFYPALLDRLATRLQACGYRLLLLTAPADGTGEELYSEVLAYQVDGIILASLLLSSALAEQCRAAGVPVVLVNRRVADANASSVTADNRTGARVIADFLLAGGHSRFAYLAGLHSSSTNRDREQAFRKRLAEAGHNEILREEGHYTQHGAREAARRLLSRQKPPDAIFCANDHMAFAAMDVARFERGLDVPRDVSIVGFDDVVAAAWPAYALTTFEQPVDAMAEATINLMLARLSSNAEAADFGQHIRIPGDLVVRSSARRPADDIVAIDGRDVWRPTTPARRARRKPPAIKG